MRLFVALSLPETVQDRLSDLCQGVPSAKWVAPENLHLTLRFIGEVDHAEADEQAGPRLLRQPVDAVASVLEADAERAEVAAIEGEHPLADVLERLLP